MDANNSHAMDTAERAAPAMSESFRAGLTLLWQAYAYSHDAGADLWDFALEIDNLYQAGLTISDLRWLAVKGYVQHGQETSVYGDAHRSFRPSEGLNFSADSCFVLTQQGAGFAEKVLKEPSVAN